jgi:hypothetical protein
MGKVPPRRLDVTAPLERLIREKAELRVRV